MPDDPQPWRCVEIEPCGRRCPYPGRITVAGGPLLCKRHAYPEGQPATTQPPGWNDDPQDGHDD